MKKYVYENATVYITIPTEEQVQNIRKSTEKFVHKLAKEGFIGHDKRQNNNRVSRISSDARKRDQYIEK